MMTSRGVGVASVIQEQWEKNLVRDVLGWCSGGATKSLV